MYSVSLVGLGRLGGALAIALSDANFRVDHLVHRSTRHLDQVLAKIGSSPIVSKLSDVKDLDSDMVIITSADQHIAGIAAELVERLSADRIVLHTSGSLSSEALRLLSDAGHETGSIHPLVSVNDPISGSESFKKVFFCIEGSGKAIEAAEKICTELGGLSFRIDSNKKGLYHAAAVMSAGHVSALINIAAEMLSRCGLEGKEPEEILLPLLRSTVRNIETSGTTAALTGTFARFDLEGMKRHLHSLGDVDIRDALDVYVALGMRSLDMAERQTDSPQQAASLRNEIKLVKKSLK